MNESAALETISRCFCEVMEKQVFMFPEWRSHEDLPRDGAGFVGAEIRFQGGEAGALLLAVPNEIAFDIAANFLGLEEGDPFALEMGVDAVKEILNITCGHAITELYGDDPEFNLSVPETSSLSCERVALLAELGESLVFDVEGHPVVLRAELGARALGRGPASGEAKP